MKIRTERLENGNLRVRLPVALRCQGGRRRIVPLDGDGAVQEAPLATMRSLQGTPCLFMKSQPRSFFNFTLASRRDKASPQSSMHTASKFFTSRKNNIRVTILVNLVLQGRIAMTIPDKPNSRLQKYITIK